MLEGILAFIVFLIILGVIITIPFWIISSFEMYYKKKLYVVHLLINAIIILVPIYITLTSHFSSSTSSSGMVHGPTPEMVLGILFIGLLVAAYPALLLFYIFGIKLLKHYFLESHKAIRITFIVMYSIYTVLIIGIGVISAIDEFV